MPKFQDAEGRTWTARVDLGVLRELEQTTGKPLLCQIADAELLRTEIIGRADIVAKGLYYACRSDAEKRAVSYEAFERAISGPAVGAAAQAFFAALMECFPSAEEKKKADPQTASRGPGRPSTRLQRLVAWLRRMITR